MHGAVGLVADSHGRCALTAAATDQPTQPRDMQRRSGQRDFNARLRKARTIAAMPPASEGVTALGAALVDQPDAPQFANAPADRCHTDVLPQLARFAESKPAPRGGCSATTSPATIFRIGPTAAAATTCRAPSCNR